MLRFSLGFLAITAIALLLVTSPSLVTAAVHDYADLDLDEALVTVADAPKKVQYVELTGVYKFGGSRPMLPHGEGYSFGLVNFTLFDPLPSRQDLPPKFTWKSLNFTGAVINADWVEPIATERPQRSSVTLQTSYIYEHIVSNGLRKANLTRPIGSPANFLSIPDESWNGFQHATPEDDETFNTTVFSINAEFMDLFEDTVTLDFELYRDDDPDTIYIPARVPGTTKSALSWSLAPPMANKFEVNMAPFWPGSSNLTASYSLGWTAESLQIDMSHPVVLAVNFTRANAFEWPGGDDDGDEDDGDLQFFCNATITTPKSKTKTVVQVPVQQTGFAMLEFSFDTQGDLFVPKGSSIAVKCDPTTSVSINAVDQPRIQSWVSQWVLLPAPDGGREERKGNSSIHPSLPTRDRNAEDKTAKDHTLLIVLGGLAGAAILLALLVVIFKINRKKAANAELEREPFLN